MGIDVGCSGQDGTSTCLDIEREVVPNFFSVRSMNGRTMAQMAAVLTMEVGTDNILTSSPVELSSLGGTGLSKKRVC